MAERPVVKASPLIFLARSRLVDLLQLAGPEVVVPRPVAVEIQRRGPDDPACRALVENAWLIVVDPPAVPPKIQNWDLGPGEASVLAWCLSHPGAAAILDDLAGRRCADALGIPVRGTLGLVLVGKERGLYSEARPILESMRHAGMYLSEGVLKRALKMVGE